MSWRFQNGDAFYSNGFDYPFGSEIGTGDFTIAFWFYTNTPGGTAECAFGQGANAEPAVYAREGPFAFNWSFKIGGSHKSFSTTLTGSTWTHLIVERSGGTITGYVNGTSDGTASNSTNWPLKADRSATVPSVTFHFLCGFDTGTACGHREPEDAEDYGTPR